MPPALYNFHKYSLWIGILGKKIYRFNRTSGFQSALGKKIEKIIGGKWRRRAIIFFVALLIGFRLYLTGRRFSQSVFSTIISSNYNNYVAKICIFLNLDILLLLIFAALILAAACIFPGLPGDEKRLSWFPSLRGHPLITGGLASVIIFLILTNIPHLFADLMTLPEEGFFHRSPISEYDALFGFFVLPPKIFWTAALGASLAIAISLADIAADKGVLRWWSIPFLFLPLPYPFQFPILWWNFAQGWLPSSLWRFFRPLLAVATVVPLFTSFLEAQPIRPRIPMFEGTRSGRAVPMTWLENGWMGKAYQIEPYAGQGDKFFCRWSGKLCLFKRVKGKWEYQDDQDLGFYWNEASFDFNTEKAYIFDATTGVLSIIDVNPSNLALEKRVRLEKLSNFPFSTHQAYDPKRRILYLTSLEGRLVGYETENFQKVLSYSFINHDDQIVEMLYDEDRDLLFVLQVFGLTVFSGEDGKIRRVVKMDYEAFGLFLDRATNRLLISYPGRMAVGMMSPDGEKVTEYRDAPAGVRIVQSDPSRGLYFMGAFTGVLEIRSMSDFRLVGRTRLVPWIHWMAPMPDYGDIIVTGGESRPAAYHYDPPIIDHGFVGTAEWWLERAARRFALPGMLKPRVVPQ